MLFVFYLNTISAQDIPVTIQKLTDGVLQMPSQTGVSRGSAYLAYRKGSEIAGAPTVQIAGLHTLVGRNRLGVGFNVYMEQINIMKNTNFNLSLAYHLPIQSKTKLSFGINSEYHVATVNASQLNSAVDLQDPQLLNLQTYGKLDFSPGLAINHSKYLIGVTANRLRALMEEESSKVSLVQSFYTGFAGYRWTVRSKNLLEPLVIIRYHPVQNAFKNDYQLFYTYNQTMMLGATYRGQGVYAASAGYTFFKRLVIGYTYQFATGGLTSVYQTNTHEISLRFNFNKQFYNQPMFSPEQRPMENISKEKFN